ncbi:hypothetical protein GCM10010405_01200 [Streptomyces macrosporus]|uniref:Uncharacterized protein n=1 Tax=Streptomyces macrosporus TaxID=44032 RepID=A0ABP5WB22_9ACTN
MNRPPRRGRPDAREAVRTGRGGVPHASGLRRRKPSALLAVKQAVRPRRTASVVRERNAAPTPRSQVLRTARKGGPPGSRRPRDRRPGTGPGTAERPGPAESVPRDVRRPGTPAVADGRKAVHRTR